jgi:hypothetical protein
VAVPGGEPAADRLDLLRRSLIAQHRPPLSGPPLPGLIAASHRTIRRPAR